MLLAIGHIIWPITCMDHIVVEQREWTLLNGGSAVPALPIPGAGSGVRKDAVLPLAVVTCDWLFCRAPPWSVWVSKLQIQITLTSHNTSAIRTSNSVRVIAIRNDSSLVSGKRQTVRTGLDHCLSIRVTLIVIIAVFFVREDNTAVLIPAQILCCLSCSSLTQAYTS